MNEQVILHPEGIYELSEINHEELLLESQELKSSESSINNLNKSGDMSRNNCNVYPMEMKSGYLQSRDEKKKEDRGK